MHSICILAQGDGPCGLPIAWKAFFQDHTSESHNCYKITQFTHLVLLKQCHNESQLQGNMLQKHDMKDSRNGRDTDFAIGSS